MQNDFELPQTDIDQLSTFCNLSPFSQRLLSFGTKFLSFENKMEQSEKLIMLDSNHDGHVSVLSKVGQVMVLSPPKLVESDEDGIQQMITRKKPTSMKNLARLRSNSDCTTVDSIQGFTMNHQSKCTRLGCSEFVAALTPLETLFSDVVVESTISSLLDFQNLNKINDKNLSLDNSQKTAFWDKDTVFTKEIEILMNDGRLTETWLRQQFADLKFKLSS